MNNNNNATITIQQEEMSAQEYIAGNYGEAIARIARIAARRTTDLHDQVLIGTSIFLFMHQNRKGGKIIAARQDGLITTMIVRTDIRGNLYDGHYHIDTIKEDGSIQMGLVEEHDAFIERLFASVDMSKL